jgi:hypothetical protein
MEETITEQQSSIPADERENTSVGLLAPVFGG